MSAQPTTDLPDVRGPPHRPRARTTSADARVVGTQPLDALVDPRCPVPSAARARCGIDPAASEAAVVEELRALARRNTVMTLDDRARLLRHA